VTRPIEFGKLETLREMQTQECMLSQTSSTPARTHIHTHLLKPCPTCGLMLLSVKVWSMAC
jgi:hypothetical protein